MKLLILSHTSYLLGGAEMSLLNTVDHWTREYDIEPVFILRRPLDKLATALDERGWKYYDLEYTFWSDGNPPTKPEDVFRAALRNSRAVRAIEKIILEENPDAVMTNSVVCPWAALASYFQLKPHVWFVREYGDLDHGRTFEIGREKTLHDVGELSEIVVTNSRTLAEHVGQYVDKEKLTTMYTPFSLEVISSQAKEEVASPFRDTDSLKLVIAGSLVPSKGQREAIEAMGMLSKDGANIELCVIGGNGPKEYLDDLRDIMKQYEIEDRVHFVGFQKNPLPYLRHADVGLMTSRKEAFGRVTFEYIATGRAVVGANSGATPEMAIDGVTGYLYDQGDAKSLASALKHYIDNPRLVEKHGAAARAHAETMMNGEFNADALYEKIASIPPNPRPVSGPIHYLSRWYEYLEAAEQSMRDAGTFSLKRLIKLRIRQKAKAVYYKLRGVKAKVKG